MAGPRELFITLDGGRRVTAHVGSHEIHTDQAVQNGGDDSAPTPYEIFLGAIGACAGIYVQGFCATRGIDSSNIVIRQWPRYDERGTLRAVELAIELPPGFPPRYQQALVRVVEQCSVRRAIAARPEFLVRISASQAGPALVAH